MSSEELKNLAYRELVQIGLLNSHEHILDFHIEKVRKAYPVYSGAYGDFGKVQEYLDSILNLYPIGRNGMHRYNNQDHSMLTAMASVQSILGKYSKKDIWKINANQEYHEQVKEEKSITLDFKDKGISVFFPCYNEEGNILQTYESITNVLKRITNDYEIIFVNDGSTDKTEALINKIIDRDSKVKIVNHEKNLGYGLALRSGFEASKKDIIFYSDCDGQFDFNEFNKILPLINDFDVISCYRNKRSENALRSFNAWCWSKLIFLFLGLNLRDIDCAFKIYRKEIFDKISLVSTGALIDAEILVRAKNKGYTIKQIGVTHLPRTTGVSTGSSPGVILKAISELLKFTYIIKKDDKRVSK